MRSLSRNALAASLVLAGLAFAPLTNAQLFESQRSHGGSKATMIESELLAGLDTPLKDAECDDEAGELRVGAVRFECSGLDVASFTPDTAIFANRHAGALGGGLSDVWGWVSPDTGDEYVIVGTTNGAAALRVTDPSNPEFLGTVFNTSPAQLIWFDIKINNDHAYIVSESAAMGMKILDLTLLDGLGAAPAGATVPLPAVTYPIDLTAHNVVINEESDMLYLVGSGSDGIGTFIAGTNSSVGCQTAGTANGDLLDNNGLFAFDISNPQVPVPAGCHTAEGYVHDAHCVVYDGPDTEHQGKEICLSAHEEGVSVVDMTDPLNSVTLSDTTDEDYPRAGYSHQGWLSEDHAFFFHGDEGDEGSDPTRTFVFDVRDLDDIALHFINEPGGMNIDHNMYTHRGLLFQSNYTAGLQVFDTARVNEPVVDADGNVVANGSLPLVAEFDVYPDDFGMDPAVFAGTWSNYPYFPSGTIAVTATEDGLFLLTLDPELAAAYPAE